MCGQTIFIIIHSVEIENKQTHFSKWPLIRCLDSIMGELMSLLHIRIVNLRINTISPDPLLFAYVTIVLSKNNI